MDMKGASSVEFELVLNFNFRSVPDVSGKTACGY